MLFLPTPAFFANKNSNKGKAMLITYPLPVNNETIEEMIAIKK